MARRVVAALGLMVLMAGCGSAPGAKDDNAKETATPAATVAASSEGTVRVPGVQVEAVDTTGAGDLFSAAYVWADHWGAGLNERLRWAVLDASLSVRVATAVAGAVPLRALLEEGAEHGLASPVRQPSAAMKEDQ